MTAASLSQDDVWDREYRSALSLNLARESRNRALGELEEADGYLLLPAGTLPEYANFRCRVRELFEARCQPDGSMRIDPRTLGEEQDPRNRKIKMKDYMQSVLWAEDFARYPELLALGLNRSVLAIVCRYLGTLPVLRTVQVFWTPPPKAGDKPEGSQFYHFDHDSYRELKMFFYIEDMDEQGGPLTFLPKSLSDEVAKRAKPFKGKRYTDEEVYGVCQPGDTIRLTGPAGTGAIVDTSNCLHFGGRIDNRGRLLVQHHYLRADSNVIGYGRINMGAIPGLDLDDLDRMVVAVPPWAELQQAS